MPRLLAWLLLLLLFAGCSGSQVIPPTPSLTPLQPTVSPVPPARTPTSVPNTPLPTLPVVLTPESTLMPAPEPTSTPLPSAPTVTPLTFEPTASPAPSAPAFPTAPVPLTPPSEVAIVVARVPTDQPVIALTFDAGADRGYAGQILDTLAAEGIKATFGMTGRWAEANPDLVRRMVDEGHQLINHTYSHPSFTGRSTGQPPLSTDERLAELRRVEEVVAQVTGSLETMRPYFRPPYGDYDDSVLRDVLRAGYTVVVMWSVDSLGWRGLTAQEITDRCLAGAEPGGMILMHVGGQSADALALPGLIAALRERGYRFVTVAELLQHAG